jgi:membrane-bound ClpP family serine protease
MGAMRPRQLLAVAILAFGLVSLGGGFALAQTPQPGPIDIVEVEGLIDPPMARFITDRVAAASSDGAQLVIVRFDSPSAVGVDADRLLDTFEGSGVPVVAWVAPRGAEAKGLAGRLFAVADAGYASGEAASLADLLQAIDGASLDGTDVESWDEERGFPGVLLRFQELPLWDRLLHAVTTPTAALFLILLGAFGLIFETYNPGIGIAAAVGAVLLTLGFYALDVLPTNWWALLIITVAVVALIYDVHVAGFGIFTIGGLFGVAIGSVLLFPGGTPALDVNIPTVIAAVVLTIVFFVSVMTAALRVRLRRPITDEDGIVGSVAEAQTDIAPEGTVISNGTLWRARTMETGIAAGSKVEVKATEGLVLLVEPLHEEN